MKSYEKLKAKVAIYEELLNNLDLDFREMINNPDSFAEGGETFSESEKKLMAYLSHYFTHQLYLKEKEIWALK